MGMNPSLGQHDDMVGDEITRHQMRSTARSQSATRKIASAMSCASKSSMSAWARIQYAQYSRKSIAPYITSAMASAWSGEMTRNTPA